MSTPQAPNPSASGNEERPRMPEHPRAPLVGRVCYFFTGIDCDSSAPIVAS